jgi:cyanate permease
MFRLKPRERRRDAVITVLLCVAVIYVGIAIGVGWAGVAGVAVAFSQVLIPSVCKRIKDRARSR